MPLSCLVPASRTSLRFVCLTAMTLAMSLGLSGCSTTSAMQNQQETMAYTGFTDTLAADMYAAVAPAAGENKEPLIEALAGLAPEGKTFAFADGIDINMLVPVARGNVSADQRRADILAAAGLRARATGAVFYIERATSVTAAAPVRAAPQPAPAQGYDDAYNSQLTSSTLMSAPLLSGGERINSSANPAPSAPVVVTTSQPVVLRSVATGQEVVLASSSSSPAPVVMTSGTPVSSASAMPMAEETIATIEPANAPVTLASDTRVVETPRDVVIVPQLNALEPAAATAVETNPTVIAATDVNDRAIMESVSGVASEPVATHAYAQDTWRAERGQTLRTVLEGWSERADVQLVWSSDFDYPLAASVTLNDSFENAVRTLLSGFGAVSPQPFGRLHRQGNAGQRVLIVETRGNLYQDQ